LENTNMRARHEQTEGRPNGRRSPSKGETQQKMRKKKGKGDKRIEPDDIHVNTNLAFVRPNIIIFIERKKG